MERDPSRPLQRRGPFRFFTGFPVRDDSPNEKGGNRFTNILKSKLTVIIIFGRGRASPLNGEKPRKGTVFSFSGMTGIEVKTDFLGNNGPERFY